MDAQGIPADAPPDFVTLIFAAVFVSLGIFFAFFPKAADRYWPWPGIAQFMGANRRIFSWLFLLFAIVWSVIALAVTFGGSE